MVLGGRISAEQIHRKKRKLLRWKCIRSVSEEEQRKAEYAVQEAEQKDESPEEKQRAQRFP